MTVSFHLLRLCHLTCLKVVMMMRYLHAGECWECQKNITTWLLHDKLTAEKRESYLEIEQYNVPEDIF